MKRLRFFIAASFLIALGASSIFPQTLYWENPKPVTSSSVDCRFPTAVSGTTKKSPVSAAFWEEIDKEKKEIHISISTSTDSVNWSAGKRFAGPFSYSGEIPEIYSAALNTKGTMAVAVLSGLNEISVFTSSDASNFKQTKLPEQDVPLVGPRIFATSSDTFVLFATKGKNESFSLVYSTSKNGSDWTDFSPFNFSFPGASNPLIPYLAPVNGGDMIAFQAHYSSGSHYSFQIFTSLSKDSGKTWSEPVMATETVASYQNYSNQRPVIQTFGKESFIAWERSPFNSSNTSVYVGKISADGKLLSEPDLLSTTPGSLHPEFFVFNDSLYLMWTESQGSNNKMYMSQRLDLFWDDPVELAQKVTTSTFPVTASKQKELAFVWQQAAGKGNYQIAMLLKDSSAVPPRIVPRSFEEGRGGTSSTVLMSLEESSDSSGIKGFSYIWTRDINEEPKEEITNFPQENQIETQAPEDGLWYLKAKQVDYADNWSKSATLCYRRDTVAPAKIIFDPLPLDDNGLLKSNTFSISWNHDPADTDVDGYTWALQYVDSIPSRLAVNASHPLRLSSQAIEEIKQKLLEKNERKIQNPEDLPKYARGDKEALSESFTNKRNGVYLFTVSAIDDVGNVSEPVTEVLFLNKYVPQTYITAINTQFNVFGDLDMEIFGGGFTYEGTISRIYVDSDGKAPYDYTISAADGAYTVTSDNRITGLTLQGIDAGDYYVGLYHTDRGTYISKSKILTVKEFGTVKPYKEFKFLPKWLTYFGSGKFRIDISLIAVIVILILGIFVFIAAFKGLTRTAKEAMVIQAEVKALIEGDIMPEERKNKQEMMHRKGLSLRVKLVAYTMTLIVVLIVSLAIALGYFMIKREEQTRAKGLQEKVHVILDSIASGAKINLPNASSNLLALSDLTEESLALSDANYATITGFSETENDMNLDYIWATNDPSIASKIDTPSFVLGQSRLNFENMKELSGICASLNEKAGSEVNFIAEQITELTEEGISLAGSLDEESIKRQTEISEITTQLSNRVNTILDELASSAISSYPTYDSTSIDAENTIYQFYKPVLYRHGSEQNYVHGIVFVEISTEALVNEIRNAQSAIIKMTGIIVGLGLLLGFFFSFIISLIIVRPIVKLAKHVAMIRDTDNKENLSGKDIIIKSKDEIGMLGDTVNEMTHGLVEAAVQAKNLTFGKEVQTRFIPLQTDEKGNTLTYGFMKTEGADFFSYYAGADDLSGDYFDYKQIDKDHYIIIKCDVSGHGVPAALIMVEVAALFLNAFSNWSMKNPAQGTNLGPVVGQINDLIESRGFKGRFAAFTLCLMNTRTGDCWFCNAGDSLVQIYDGTEKKKKSINLPETPAAGMFSTDLVDMKGGYKVVKLTLKKNDVLFLYTDGIEEAKRNFRNADGKIVTCQESGLKDGDEHGNHTVGESSEEMTPERVNDIIESVYSRGSYELKKWHNPNPNETFTFDFSNCDGTAEEAIMALVSVEKVFRMYQTKGMGQSDKVKADKKIDEFLRMHFRDYSTYCMNRSEVETDPTHVYYSGIREDQQYDDLTLVAIKKN